MLYWVNKYTSAPVPSPPLMHNAQHHQSIIRDLLDASSVFRSPLAEKLDCLGPESSLVPRPECNPGMNSTVSVERSAFPPGYSDKLP